MQHVGGLGHQGDEVPEGVVRGRGLRHLVVRLGLDRVDEVGELHRVLDEEHRDVVADQVPVAFVGVELDREAAHVARQVGRAALAEHGREAHEHRRALAGFGERRRLGDRAERVVALEVAVRRRAARVHHALGDALVVEVGDLLAQDEVLEQRRPAQARLERVLVVGDRARPGWWSAPGRRNRRAPGRAIRCPGCSRRARHAVAELGGRDVLGHGAGGVDRRRRRDRLAGRALAAGRRRSRPASADWPASPRPAPGRRPSGSPGGAAIRSRSLRQPRGPGRRGRAADGREDVPTLSAGRGGGGWGR